MVKIKAINSRFLYGQFNQNTYVLTNETQAVIIDAGAELDEVKQAVGERKVLAILMTHLHFDHFWHIDKYLDEFDCPVYIKNGFDFKFLDGESNALTLVRIKFTKNVEKNRIKYYEKTLKLGKFKFDIISTPGHAADCVCILMNDNLFTGDTVFADTIGRTDLKDSDGEQMLESLKKIKELDFNFAYPGHNEMASKKQILNVIDFYL